MVSKLKNALLIFAVCIGTVACEKTTDLEPNPLFTGGEDVVVENSFQAKVDGSLFIASKITAITTSASSLSISATDDAGEEAIGLTFPPNVKEGTYDLTSLSGDYRAQYNESKSKFFAADDGKLNITSNNTTKKVVTGTFNFNGSELLNPSTVVVTEGSFTVNY